MEINHNYRRRYIVFFSHSITIKNNPICLSRLVTELVQNTPQLSHTKKIIIQLATMSSPPFPNYEINRDRLILQFV